MHYAGTFTPQGIKFGVFPEVCTVYLVKRGILGRWDRYPPEVSLHLKNRDSEPQLCQESWWKYFLKLKENVWKITHVKWEKIPHPLYDYSFLPPKKDSSMNMLMKLKTELFSSNYLPLFPTDWLHLQMAKTAVILKSLVNNWQKKFWNSEHFWQSNCILFVNLNHTRKPFPDFEWGKSIAQPLT